MLRTERGSRIGKTVCGSRENPEKDFDAALNVISPAILPKVSRRVSPKVSRHGYHRDVSQLLTKKQLKTSRGDKI